MTGWDDSGPPRPGFSSGKRKASADADILEQGKDRLPFFERRVSPAAVVLAAAGLLLGVAGGYAVGYQRASNRGASLSRTRSAATGTLILSQPGSQCSAQIGHALQLGVQVTNQSATAVTLRQVKAVLPLGGLKAISQAWGPCGELPRAGHAPASALPAGASTWFTVTFTVLENCPLQYPVQFTIDYDQTGRAGTVNLPGFADLSHVPYLTCPVAGP